MGYQWLFLCRSSDRDMNPTASYYLVLRLRMCGAILPPPHIPSWQSCLIKFWEKFAVVVVVVVVLLMMMMVKELILNTYFEYIKCHIQPQKFSAPSSCFYMKLHIGSPDRF
jgi:hypothetical protein